MTGPRALITTRDIPSVRAIWRTAQDFFKSHREIDLDVVRGIAILLAIGWHLNTPVTNTIADFLLFPGARFGWAGVDLFFVLSGFLVGRMLLKERAKYGKVNLKIFYVRRILRLWPVMYAFLFAMLLMAGLSYRTFFFQIALHVQDYFYTQSATHLWSLAVEEQFYIAVSIGLVIADRYRASARALLYVLLTIPILAFGLRVWASMAGWSPEDIQLQFQFRMDALAAGVILALLSIEYPAAFMRLLVWRPLWIAVAVLGFGTLTFIDKATQLGETVGYTIGWLSSAALILATYKSGIENRAKFLCKMLSFFGLIAYPLYLWHVPVARVIRTAFEKRHYHHPLILISAEYLAAIAVAAVMRAGIELPVMLWRDRVTPARAEPVTQTVPKADPTSGPLANEI